MRTTGESPRVLRKVVHKMFKVVRLLCVCVRMAKFTKFWWCQQCELSRHVDDIARHDKSSSLICNLFCNHLQLSTNTVRPFKVTGELIWRRSSSSVWRSKSEGAVSSNKRAEVEFTRKITITYTRGYGDAWLEYINTHVH